MSRSFAVQPHNYIVRICTSFFAALVLSFCSVLASAAEIQPAVSKTAHVNSDGTVTITLSVTGKQEVSTSQASANLFVSLDLSNSMAETAAYTAVSGTPSFSSTNTYYAYVNGAYTKLYVVRPPLDFLGWRTYWAYYSNNEPIRYNGTFYVASGPSKLEVAKNAIQEMGKKLLQSNSTVAITIIPFGSQVAAASDVWSAQNASGYASYVSGISIDSNNGGTNWSAALKDLHDRVAATDVKSYTAFISDGSPTFDLAGNNYYNYQNYNNYIPTLINEAASLYNTNKPKNLAGTYVIYTDSVAQASMNSLAGKIGGKLYQGTDTASLTAALNNLADTIRTEVGFSDVVVTDALSTHVKYHLDAGATTPSFTYAKNGQTWSDIPAAAKASVVNGVVKWNLSGLGVLSADTTYSLSFKTDFSQADLDISALKDGNYQVATNSNAALTYKVHTTVNGQTTTSEQKQMDFGPSPEVRVPVARLNLGIDWQGNNKKPDAVKVTIFQDDIDLPYREFWLTKDSYATSVALSANHSYRVVQNELRDWKVSELNLAYQGNVTEVKNVKLQDVAKKYKLQILTNGKSNSSTGSPAPQTPLAGASFAIKDQSGRVLHKLTTTRTGYTSAVELENGSYTVEMVSAPAGYGLIAEPMHLTVDGASWTLNYGDQTGALQDLNDETKLMVLSSERQAIDVMPSAGSSETAFMYAIALMLAVKCGFMAADRIQTART